jgi:hypothetical protein
VVGVRERRLGCESEVAFGFGEAGEEGAEEVGKRSCKRLRDDGLGIGQCGLFGGSWEADGVRGA